MLVEAIRSQAVLAEMPITLLTSAAIPAVISKAKELPVTACLIKPAGEANCWELSRGLAVLGKSLASAGEFSRNPKTS